MIELKKLRKVYRSLRGGKCVALNDIDLKLPDTGLVFIIGKSGSGKSTLLNLLGGLDTITSGDIVADGNSIASFSRADFENYRSSYIGFVFQHYYLLEELTVEENIEMAMGIVGKDNSKEVKALLERVGLEGCGKRYPRELSGGQQQRVAIARALAKDPKLILGDELTGNLDHKTSVDILNVLKEISKEKLVVVVSHNLDEADMFADRIIELHDGQVYRDRVRVKRDQKRFFIRGRVAYLPYFRDLTEKEAKALETGLKTGQITDIVQQDDGFALNGENVNSDRYIPLQNNKFVKKKKRQYTGIFVRKGAVSKVITIMIVTLMLLCVSVFSSLHKITHSEVEYTPDRNYQEVIKSDLESFAGGLFGAYMHTVLDSEYELAKETLGGNVYRIVNVTITTNPGASPNTATMYQTDIRRNMTKFYVDETYGTLICDEQLLIDEYGKDGALVVLAGEIDNDSYKVIITDYVADSFLNLYSEKYTSYEEILSGESKIGAIIDTGYRERYASIISRYDGVPESQLESLYLELCEEELFRQFQQEMVSYLGVTYTFNPNFEDAYRWAYNSYTCNLRYMSFEKDGTIYPDDHRASGTVKRNTYDGGYDDPIAYAPVEKGEMKIPYNTYNSIFGTNYTAQNYDTFVPHDVTMRIHSRAIGGGEDDVLYEKTFRVVGLRASAIHVHEDDYSELNGFATRTFGLYLENNENLEKTVSVLNSHEMTPRTITLDSISGINKMLGVFIPLFRLIAGGIYAFIVVYLISHAISNIKKNYFQIGVMRSFGAKSLDVGAIFITGILLTGLTIVTLMLAFEPLIIDVYNEILVESFSMVLNTYAHDISVINMSPWVPVINSALVIMTTLISALISLLVLRKLKPIEIIRAKDNGGEVS